MKKILLSMATVALAAFAFTFNVEAHCVLGNPSFPQKPAEPTTYTFEVFLASGQAAAKSVPTQKSADSSTKVATLTGRQYDANGFSPRHYDEVNKTMVDATADATTVKSVKPSGNDVYWKASKDGDYCIRIAFETNYRPNLAGLKSIKINFKTKAANANDPHTITPILYLKPSTYIQYPYDGPEGLELPMETTSVYHFCGVHFPDVNAGETITDLESTSFDIQPYCLFRHYVKHVELYLKGVKNGDQICFNGFTAETDPALFDKSNSMFVEYNWHMPVLNPAGNIYIQGEDFDAPFVNNRLGHSPITNLHSSHTGDLPQANTYRQHPDDRTVYMEKATAYKWATNHGWTLAGGEWTWLILKHWGDGWNKYTGEYAYENSNIITLEDAFNDFGAWADYTFYAPQDMEFDMSFRAGGCYLAFMPYVGATNLDSADNGGWLIPGCDNYYERFAGGLIVYLDGKPLKTNWDKYPKYTKGMTDAAFKNIMYHPSKWSTNTDDVVMRSYPHPNKITQGQGEWDAYTLGWNEYAHNPNGDGTLWALCNSLRNQELADYELDEEDPNDYPQSSISEEDLEYLKRADYVNIRVDKGFHTIRLQSLANPINIDAMMLQGHASTGNTDAFGKLPTIDMTAEPGYPVLKDANGNALYVNDSNGNSVPNENFSAKPGDVLRISGDGLIYVQEIGSTEEGVEMANNLGNRANAIDESWRPLGQPVEYTVANKAQTIRFKVVNPISGVTGHTYGFTVNPDDPDGKVTAIDEVVAAPAFNQAVYYNLQGQRVANPQGGMFIRVQGGKAEKVVL